MEKGEKIHLQARKEMLPLYGKPNQKKETAITMLDYTNASTIYLSQTEGDDYYSGFSPVPSLAGSGPVRTVGRVLDILWNMRACGMQQPVTVQLMGDYFLSAPIQLGFEYANEFFDRSYRFCNVTFESFGNTRAKIIGGRRLTGFQKDTFHQTDCISLYIPEVKEGTWSFTDLYVGGKRASLSRYPKTGTLRAVTTENPNPKSYQEGSRWFVAHKEDLEQISDVENAIVSYYHFWTDEHSPIESYDKETGKITMALRSRFQLSADYERNKTVDMHYYLENVSCTLSEPNEWYLDVKSGMLYYIPEDWSTPIEELEIYAPTQTQLAVIKGTAENPVSGIRFRGLDFLCTKGDYESWKRFMDDTSDEPLDVAYAADEQALCDAYGAISFAYAEDCSITDCSISCTGLHAIEIGVGCHNVRVENSRMEHIGGGGVKICGRTVREDVSKETSYCVLRGNLIRNIGKRFAAACGILLMHSSHNEISDNEVCYTDYSGISVGWVWGYKESTTYGNLIRNNHVHHIGMGEMSDMGGIYLLGPQSGTVVEGNLVHDINSSNYGACGIYTDEGSAYITVERNVVFRCKSCCYNQHFGQYVTVRNNVFAFGGKTALQMGRIDAHIGLIFEGNTVISDGHPIYRYAFENDFRGYLAGLKASANRFWSIDGKEPTMIRYTDGGKEVSLSLSEWQSASGKDVGSLIAEPIEIDIDKENRRILNSEL